AGRAGLRASGGYALFCAAGDLGLLAAPLLLVQSPAIAAGPLALAAAVRLRLFPFHGIAQLAGPSGRAHVALVLFGGLVGASLLTRAVAVVGAVPASLAAGLSAAALATAVAATLALPLPRSYRTTLDHVGLVETAHLAAA